MSHSISPIAYGMFSDSTTQSIAVTTAAQAITLNTDEHKKAITHSTSVNTSRVTVDVAGTYLITYSLVITSTNAGQTMDFWLRVNGSDVARSNGEHHLANANADQLIAATFIYNFTAGQYFELMMAGTHTGCSIKAIGTQTTPTRPATPSIILTVNRIGR